MENPAFYALHHDPTATGLGKGQMPSVERKTVGRSLCSFSVEKAAGFELKRGGIKREGSRVEVLKRRGSRALSACLSFCYASKGLTYLNFVCCAPTPCMQSAAFYTDYLPAPSSCAMSAQQCNQFQSNLVRSFLKSRRLLFL